MIRYAGIFVAALALAICASEQGTSSNQRSAQTEAGTSANAAADALNDPLETAFLAKLSTNLSVSQCKPGDPAEAEVKQDIKRGKEVVLKRVRVWSAISRPCKCPRQKNPN